MSEEQILENIKKIENDINYFKNLGFDNLVDKFQMCLDTIKSLHNKTM